MEKLVTPKLRFSEFSEEWQNKTLSEIAKITSGGTPNRSVLKYWGGNIPWISTTLIDFNIIENSEEFITIEGLENSSAKLFPKGTLLMAMYGQGKTRGKIAILGIEASTNQACGAIIPKKNIDNKYLFQNLAGRYDEIRGLSNEGGQQNLSGGIIKALKVSFPTLLEQQKIATFLTAVDTKISQLTKKKALLEQYKKGIMQKIFNQELRFKPDVIARRNDEAISQNEASFPDWETKKLGDLGSFQTSSVDKLSKEDENEVYLINYMNVYRHEEINNESVKNFQIVTANDNQIKTSNLKKGDILFTPSSETPIDIGHSVVIFEDINDAVYSYHVIRFRPKIKLDILFSHYFCNTSDVLRQLSRFSTGSTRFTISVGNFSKVKVKIPSIEEQTKIAHFLSAIDAKINHVSNQLEQTNTFKKGLLQQMFV